MAQKSMPRPAGQPEPGTPKKPAGKRVPKKGVPKKRAAKKVARASLAAAQSTSAAPSALHATGATPPQGAAASGPAVLDRLHATILDRRTADPALSHSARLLSRGMPKVAQKFGEEAVECLIEAVSGNAPAMVAESADVLYHLLVMWVAAGVAPAQVWAELERREGVSGVAEKASRPQIGTTKIP